MCVGLSLDTVFVSLHQYHTGLSTLGLYQVLKLGRGILSTSV